MKFPREHLLRLFDGLRNFCWEKNSTITIAIAISISISIPIPNVISLFSRGKQYCTYVCSVCECGSMS